MPEHSWQGGRLFSSQGKLHSMYCVRQFYLLLFFLFYMTLVSHLHVCTGYMQFLIKTAEHVGQRNPFNGREFMTEVVDTCWAHMTYVPFIIHSHDKELLTVFETEYQAWKFSLHKYIMFRCMWQKTIRFHRSLWLLDSCREKKKNISFRSNANKNSKTTRSVSPPNSLILE